MKAVVVLSGGVDSSVLLAQYALDCELYALSVDYGQRHRRELQAAAAVAAHYKAQHRVADLSALRSLLAGSSQTDASVPVPHGHYEEESMKKTVVPNRNMILLAVAGAWAVSLKAAVIAYGAQAGDHAVYPDCREAFLEPMAAAMAAADWHKVSVDAPFLRMTKAGIVELGAQLGAPLHLTYSCYEGGELHCGRCGTCTERREAFRLACVPDPTTYAL